MLNLNQYNQYIYASREKMMKLCVKLPLLQMVFKKLGVWQSGDVL